MFPLFYAERFKQHEWGTVVIHWSVFEATLREIASRIELPANHEARERAVQALADGG